MKISAAPFSPQPPPEFGQQELADFLETLPECDRATVEEGYGNYWLEQSRKEREEWRDQALVQLLKMATIDKPILTLEEAAVLIGVSPKRLQNIIYEEKKKRGRLPDFLCDGAGRLSWRVDQEKLHAWVRSSEPKRGRPGKTNSAN